MITSLRKVASESWNRLTGRGKMVLTVYSVSLMLTSLLDGVALVIFSKVGEHLNGDSGSIGKNLNLGVVCIVLFLLKSAIAVVVTWVGYTQFAQQEVLIGQENFRSYMEMDPGLMADEQQSEIFAVVDRGPVAVVQGILLSMATLLSEFVNALVLFGVLVFLDPITALTVATYFVTVALIQHRLLSVTASRAGQVVVDDFNTTYDVLSDARGLAKVLRVMPSISLDHTLAAARTRLAESRAKVSFLESLPRYFMESMLALGLVVISSVTVVFRGSDELTAALAVFGAAGFRLLPIVNRIQGIILGLLGREPVARLALRRFDSPTLERRLGTDMSAESVVRLTNVKYRYPGGQTDVLNGVSLEFRRGKKYAVVGVSGSGKTTLIDLCMGVIEPSDGLVEWHHGSPARVAYVPQETVITTSGLYENVALEWTTANLDREAVNSALQRASLEFMTTEGRFLDKEFLTGLSGGQRQRLGLARALYRDPDILFLDEPTSALDVETEHEIMQVMTRLKGHVTVVIVAHRLSTIRDADVVIFISEGRVAGMGTFSELRATLPQFNRQVELGLLTDD
mgnify:CR=1 FL=1